MLEYLLIAAGGYILGKIVEGDTKAKVQQHEQRLDRLEYGLSQSIRALEKMHYRVVDVEQMVDVLEKKVGAIVEGSRCNACGRPMVLRRNRKIGSPGYGQFFFGCSGFPNYCKATMNLSENFVSQIAIRDRVA